MVFQLQLKARHAKGNSWGFSKESMAFLGKKSPYIIRKRENEAQGQSVKVLQKQISRQG